LPPAPNGQELFEPPTERIDMFARMSVYEVPEDKRDDGIEAFRGALTEVAESPGFTGGFYFVSCDGERAMTLTMWDSRDAMETSRVNATRLRSEAARTAEGGVVSSEEFQVAFDLTQNGVAH
jgi:heme-degrading monooxygenase HmoA